MHKTITYFLWAWLSLSLGNVLMGQTFKNPILTGMNPDPSICRVGDDYYLITSTFEYFPGLPIYHSKDLVHWKQIGHVLSKPSNCPLIGATSSTGGNYAPTIRYHNGTFYVTCTNYGGNGTQGGFYVTATDPKGPWSDPYWVGNWAVDPSFLFANDSAYYVFPGDKNNFMLATVNLSTGKFHKPAKHIAYGNGGTNPEGPHLYKIKDYYYLMSAEGGTGDEHREVIQRSKSPWGPYEMSPNNPVASHMGKPSNPFQAIGHADLVQLPDSSWWLVCLGYRQKGGKFHHLGRETFLAPVTWDANGWPKVGTDGVVLPEYPVPNLPQQTFEQDSVRDSFSSTSLDLKWNFVRNPNAADWSLTEKAGHLRLKGSKYSFKEKSSPAFVARRQSHFNMVASTKIDFVPSAPNEEAGLVVRGDDANHIDLLITQLNGKRVAMLRKFFIEKVSSITYMEIPEGELILRVSATDLEYQFWVQKEGQTAVIIGTSPTKNLSTELIGGFTGTFIGMYASGNGKANTNPADFDWFDYEVDPSLPHVWSLGTNPSMNDMLTPQIVALSSSAYDKVKIVWNKVANADSYLIERLIGTSFDSVGTTSDTIFNESGLAGSTLYLYRVIAKNTKGYSLPSLASSVTTKHVPGPYLDKPMLISGKIEAENYDYGDKNETWYDSDIVNSGGKYRDDGIDINTSWDNGGGYLVGWNEAGEWLTYTVDVIDTICDLELRVLTWADYKATLKFELDGVLIAQTVIPHTSGAFQTVTVKNVKLPKGQNKKLKVSFVKGGLEFDWMRFVKSTDPNGIYIPMIKDGIFLYPNPSSNMVNISSESFKYTQIEIYDLDGKKLLTKSVSYMPELSLPLMLAKGQYMMVLSNHNEKRMLRFTKE